MFTLLVLIITSIISYRGLRSEFFLGEYKFEVNRILQYKEYIRLISSGFLHVSWGHLIVNIITLYVFGSMIEANLGPAIFLIIYITGLIGSSLFALLLHKNHPDYAAAGASGAICGLVFSFIALVPNAPIGILFLPVSIPAWLFGLLYTLFIIYAIRSHRDNIGHEAHLGGAIAAMILTVLMYPDALTKNFLPIALITASAIIFIMLILKKPGAILVQNKFYESQGLTIEDRYNISKNREKKNIDIILEKIHSKGIDSLNEREKQMLKDFSGK